MSADNFDAEDLLLVIGESTGPQTRVRDGGILCAAAARPEAVLAGKRVYAAMSWRAAALLHSIVRWEPLDMWNASFGWRAVVALVGVSGGQLMMPGKDRMVLTDDIVQGALDDVEDIAKRLAPFLVAR
jgi:death-on-curing protein